MNSPHRSVEALARCGYALDVNFGQTRKTPVTAMIHQAEPEHDRRVQILGYRWPWDRTLLAGYVDGSLRGLAHLTLVSLVAHGAFSGDTARLVVRFGPKGAASVYRFTKV